MYKKVCPRCAKSSYSSCRSGEWICPVCSNDLTFQRVLFESAQTKVTRLDPYKNRNESAVESVYSIYA
ncbi:hypothetical protein GKZ89_03140 [Bacillus mangrovi]|uniref:Uncharacterized protein n=1 Tax=Metabacillus mangrovi TaxID=1491830 RepID=A0A7X2S392_9BACI|nr:hypothetical protein [Metabacillus mangrovi]MTH52388.1 hypothetical protein [Metabacillus mangrovi]